VFLQNQTVAMPNKVIQHLSGVGRVVKTAVGKLVKKKIEADGDVVTYVVFESDKDVLDGSDGRVPSSSGILNITNGALCCAACPLQLLSQDL
jgi:hypothetical protein